MIDINTDKLCPLLSDTVESYGKIGIIQVSCQKEKCKFFNINKNECFINLFFQEEKENEK